MLKGDLATMPLADLVQWIDATRKNVVVEIERGDGLRQWLVAVDRHVVAASTPPARGVLAADLVSGGPGPGLRALVEESLLDLFFETEGKFSLREGTAPPSPGVTLELPLGFLVMEALRHLDEWPRLMTTFPDDTLRVKVISRATAAELSVVQEAIVRAAEEGTQDAMGLTLGELRLVLGLSQHALLRRVDELRSSGVVEVEGSTSARDLPATLLEQARVLLREEQFAEAAHVLRTLLSSTPNDLRLRRLLEETEKRHIEACYQQVAPTDLVRLAPPPPPGAVRQGIATAEQAIVDALTLKSRSVAGLVLVSPLRELETLVGLLRLVKKGIVEHVT